MPFMNRTTGAEVTALSIARRVVSLSCRIDRRIVWRWVIGEEEVVVRKGWWMERIVRRSYFGFVRFLWREREGGGVNYCCCGMAGRHCWWDK